jgi:hypothetical protein
VKERSVKRDSTDRFGEPDVLVAAWTADTGLGPVITRRLSDAATRMCARAFDWANATDKPSTIPASADKRPLRTPEREE